MSPLQFYSHHSKLCWKAEAVLRCPLAKDDRQSGHEMLQTFHDTRHNLCGHSPFRGAGEEGVRQRQGIQKPHRIATLAPIRFDCGPGRAVCGGRSPAGISQAKITVHRTLGQGILFNICMHAREIIRIALTLLHYWTHLLDLQVSG